MCGIAGIYWSRAGVSVDEQIVNRMKAAIQHRGPDSDGRHRSEFADVGFRRLSIIDLGGGDQPLSNEDGSVQCFLNGEIYNYLELRKELLARGHTFQTSSDTEVLPHMYEEYGTEMFQKLNGMFAICLIDIKKQRVLLARDRFGVKQLYYSETRNGVVFGSEMKPLLASGLVNAEIERSPEIHQYYQVATVPQQIEMDIEAASERTRELLWRSVDLQLQADVPVGISLSGGIDSSAIACAAMHSQLSKTKPIALTIHWPDTSPDEVESARELCKHLGMRHEVLEIPVGDFLNELPLLGWISDEPVADPATYSQYCIAKEAAKYVTVLLGGAGGDELFGGYGIYKLSKKYSVYERLPKALQNGLKPILSGSWMDEDSMSAVMEYRNSRLNWHSRAKSNLSNREQELLIEAIPGSRDPFANFQRKFKEYQHHDPINQQMIVDFQTYLPEQILTMMDRATMAASIEGRVPFLDNSLVDFAFSISAKTKMGKTPEAKRILKRAIAKDVSPTILSRKKLGMPSPFMSLLMENFAVIRRIILSADSYVRSVLPESWLQEITASETHAREHFRSLYAILTLEIWHKLFIREQVYERPKVNCLELFEVASSNFSK